MSGVVSRPRVGPNREHHGGRGRESATDAQIMRSARPMPERAAAGAVASDIGAGRFAS